MLPTEVINNNLNAIAHATVYHAVWCRNLRELFDDVNKSGIAFQNFIDIGSGKGKACFYAKKNEVRENYWR